MYKVKEIHPSVDATAIEAKQEKQLKAKRRKAAKSLVTRVVIAAVGILVLSVFGWLGWIIMPLVLALEIIIMLWAAIWFGAWLQFRFAEGGLLDAHE